RAGTTAVALNHVAFANTAASATEASARRAPTRRVSARAGRPMTSLGVATRGIVVRSPIVNAAEQVVQPRAADGHRQQRLVVDRAIRRDQEEPGLVEDGGLGLADAARDEEA